jgi:mono/diheme cytochrome c family protein
MMNRQWHNQRWLFAVLALLFITGCGRLTAPLPGEGRRPIGLVQPVTLEQVYAPRAIAQRPLRHAADAEVAATPEATALIEAGLPLYAVNCAPCHQADGEGKLNRFPALNQNAFVTNRSPAPLIRTVLYGRGIMPAFVPTLNDRELAAVLTYIRQAWNNDADAVLPSQVHEVATTEENE